jgi:hypothetical protein
VQSIQLFAAQNGFGGSGLTRPYRMDCDAVFSIKNQKERKKRTKGKDQIGCFAIRRSHDFIAVAGLIVSSFSRAVFNRARLATNR